MEKQVLVVQWIVWEKNKMELIIIILGSLFLIVTAVAILLTIKTIRLRKRLLLLAISLVKVEEMANLKNQDISDGDVHQENFIKFLSDSRDWAFAYIEDVQQGLSKFVNTVDADISYFDEYGEVLSISRPDYESMKNISKAYKELKALLPTEEDQNV